MPYRSITYFTDDIHFCMTIWKTLKGVHLWKCFIYTIIYSKLLFCLNSNRDLKNMYLYFILLYCRDLSPLTCRMIPVYMVCFHDIVIFNLTVTLLYDQHFFFYPCSTYETESWKSIQYMVSITFQHLINNCDLDLWPSDPKIYKNPPLLWPLHVSL